MEVGAHHDGFCDSHATDITRACCGMRDCESAHKVGTLFGCVDDLHSGGILQVIHSSPVTWSVSFYSIGPGSQVYSSFFRELPASHGDIVDD